MLLQIGIWSELLFQNPVFEDSTDAEHDLKVVNFLELENNLCKQASLVHNIDLQRKMFKNDNIYNIFW